MFEDIGSREQVYVPQLQRACCAVGGRVVALFDCADGVVALSDFEDGEATLETLLRNDSID